MAYTLLQLVDQVCGEMGLLQPSAIIGSSNNQSTQLLALTQRLGKDLVREYEWQKLVKTYVFQTTVALTKTGYTVSGTATITGMSDTTNLAIGDVVSGLGIRTYTEILSIDSATAITLTMPATSTNNAATYTFAKQDYALPAGFDRMVSDSSWDRTNHWPTLGSTSSQSWQTIQGGVVSTGPRTRFRLYGNYIRIVPAATAVLNMSFEYVSSYWVLASGGTSATKATFTIDSDTCIFPDDLMMAGLKMYFLKAKKFDFGAELAEFARALSNAKAQDVPAPVRSLSPYPMPYLLGTENIPDGNWGT